MRTDTIVVTGGAGFIGSALIRRLVEVSDSRIINVDALTYAANLASLPAACDNRLILEEVNIADASAVDRVFCEYRPTAVVHLAAESHVDRSIDGPALFLQTNIVGTYNLLEASLSIWRSLKEPTHSAFRFLHVSTDEVFGSLGETGSFRESAPYAPSSPYAATKAAADHLVHAWYRTYGLPAIITNCSNNYGPYQFPEKLIPHIIISALNGQPLPVYGDGQHVRDWLHVEDHVDALLAIVEHSRIGESYNIGSRNERTTLEVVGAICRILDELEPRNDGASYTQQISHVSDRPGHDRRYAIDPSKLEADLGWCPQRSWEDGLRQTIRWYLDNRPWWEAIRDGSYRGERLGLGR